MHVLWTCAALQESQLASVAWTVGCVYFFTQVFYSWVFILKKFQQNKISTRAQTCVCSLTLQQILSSSCPRIEFCECGWERITSVVSFTSSWNLSFLLQLWMWATNHSNASSTSDFIRVQVLSYHNCCRNLEVSFIFITTLKFTEVIRPTFRSYLVGKWGKHIYYQIRL